LLIFAAHSSRKSSPYADRSEAYQLRSLVTRRPSTAVAENELQMGARGEPNVETAAGSTSGDDFEQAIRL